MCTYHFVAKFITITEAANVLRRMDNRDPSVSLDEIKQSEKVKGT